MKKIKILIISHNRYITLERAVRSCYHSINFAKECGYAGDFEIVVQDDSTVELDKVEKICELYNARLVHTAPMCNAEAWEAGLISCGEADYIKILFDDDHIQQPFLVSTCSLMDQAPHVNLIITAAVVDFPPPQDQLILYKFTDAARVIGVSTEDFLRRVMIGVGNGGMPESPSCCLFRNTGDNIKIRYKEFVGTPLEQYARKVYFNDLLMLMDVTKGSEEILIIQDPLVWFGTDAESITLTKGTEVAKARHLFREYYRKAETK